MKKLVTIIALLTATFSLFSCEKYDDGRPSKEVRDHFSDLFPDARDIDWDREGSYWVVSFETGSRHDETDHEVWYNSVGAWVGIITSVSIASVPAEIMGYLKASEYSAATPEDNDAEFIETPAGNYYRFDMQLNGKDVDLDVSLDGVVTISKKFF